MLCCKKHLYYKLNWNYWLEMGGLAQRPDLLGIHINGIISAGPTMLRLASRAGLGAAMTWVCRGEQKDVR